MLETLFNSSLWGDEAFSAVLAQKPFWPMIRVVAKDTSPPLFYILSFLWFRIFGPSEIAIRSLSLFFYLATTVVIYFLAKTLFDKKAGLIAACLSFFNPFLFPYAFEGRMYYCLLFFSTLSFYLLIKKNRAGYILSAAATLYSHHFGIFALISQFLWQVINRERKFKEIFLDYLIIGTLYLPWLYPLYLQTTLVSTGFWLGKPKPKDLINLFKNFLVNQTVYKSQNFIPFLAMVTLILRKWIKKTLRQDLLLILWLIIPPLLTFLVSQTKLSIFYERYLLYCVPALTILLASQTRKISFVFIIPIVAISFFASLNYFLNPYKKPFREFTNWIKKNVGSETFIFNYNGKAHHLWETKYYGLEAPLLIEAGSPPFYIGTAQMTENDIIHNLPQGQFVGAITSDPPETVSASGYKIQDSYRLDSLYFVFLEPDEK